MRYCCPTPILATLSFSRNTDSGSLLSVIPSSCRANACAEQLLVAVVSTDSTCKTNSAEHGKFLKSRSPVLSYRRRRHNGGRSHQRAPFAPRFFAGGLLTAYIAGCDLL